MWNLGDPFIPVLIHKVVYNAAGCEGKVFEEVLVLVECFHRGSVDDFCSVGRYDETFYAVLNIRHPFHIRTIGIHYENLHFLRSVIFAEEGNFGAISYPLQI